MAGGDEEWEEAIVDVVEDVAGVAPCAEDDGGGLVANLARRCGVWGGGGGGKEGELLDFGHDVFFPFTWVWT